MTLRTIPRRAWIKVVGMAARRAPITVTGRAGGRIRTTVWLRGYRSQSRVLRFRATARIYTIQLQRSPRAGRKRVPPPKRAGKDPYDIGEDL